MNRFFIDKKYIAKDHAVISDPKDVHHLVKVLRLGCGEILFISDGDGKGYKARVSKIHKDCVVLDILDNVAFAKRGDQPILISLACSVPKNTHFEEVVDKCTQLGVNEIIPIITKRTLVSREAFEKKKDRLNNVMMAAAKQSGILFLPVLKDAIGFPELLTTFNYYDLRLLPHLHEKTTDIKEVVKGFNGKKILVMIGPEGDFTEEEIEAALKCGCSCITLGSSVLRVDTAAISVLSFLRLYFGT